VEPGVTRVDLERLLVAGDIFLQHLRRIVHIERRAIAAGAGRELQPQTPISDAVVCPNVTRLGGRFGFRTLSGPSCRRYIASSAWLPRGSGIGRRNRYTFLPSEIPVSDENQGRRRSVGQSRKSFHLPRQVVRVRLNASTSTSTGSTYESVTQ